MTDLHPEQAQRLASDPEASVWVAASAGTGKTKVLTDRVLSLMLEGTRPERILCLTFTRAAAAEMNIRIADKLGKWAIAEADALEAEIRDLLGRAPKSRETVRARTLFARVLDTPGGMHIETIHAFCQSLLRRFPLEAGVAPHFQVMDERDAAEMMAGAREVVLAAARAESDTGLAEALAKVTAHAHESAFSDLLGTLASERGRLARLIARFGSVEAAMAALRGRMGIGADETPESVVRDACEDDAFDGLLLRMAVGALEQGSGADQKRAATMAAWLAAAPDERFSRFAEYRSVFLTQQGGMKNEKNLITKKAKEASAGAENVMFTEAARLNHVETMRRAAVSAMATAGLLELGRALLAAYEKRKKARALLDYDDLILTAVELLREEANASWVMFKLDRGVEHVLIDEAQDTNPDQWTVARALTREYFAGEGAHDFPRTVFAVGDVKQSIYSFQRADPDEFFRMRDHFAERVPQANATWREVDLSVSFRSTGAVLEAVDAVFADGSAAAAGVALDAKPIAHAAWREGDGGLVELWPAVEPDAADETPPWKPPVERVEGETPQKRLARLLAVRIEAMTSGAEILESKGRPIRPGDVMVLVRRRTAFVDELVRALKERGVEVAGVDRMVLTDQMAVMDLAALGRFLLLPGDDLTLACVLTGPLVGLTDEDLFELAWKREGSLWDSLRANAAKEEKYAEAHAYLSDLLARADYAPPFELYAHILGALGGRRKLVARLGRDAEDPIAEFLDLAVSFERAHAPSLQGFLHWVEAGGVEVKRDLEQETQNAVRVMTAHGAKGLQAPIVFLPDTMQAPRQGASILWPRDYEGRELFLWTPSASYREGVADMALAEVKKKRDEEYRRLLYVAMTRAEDRLYVCGWRGRQAPPDGCWGKLIRDGLAGVAAPVEDAFLAQSRAFEDATVLRLVRPQTREAEKKDEAAAAPVAGALPEWAQSPPPPEPDPPAPLTPSRPGDDEPPARSPFGPDDGARFRRGRLIHRLLQSLPDLPESRRADAARAFLARSAHGLGPDEQAEIAEETLRTLSHPDFTALFGPGSLAEAPLIGRVGGQVISAQVDRLLVEDERVTVIDYKTNRPAPKEVEAVPKVYLKQMAAYRAALGAMYPGRAIRCLLLWTDGPWTLEPPGALLDRYAP